MSPDRRNNSKNHTKGWVHTHSATIVDLFRLVDAGWIVAGLWLSCKYNGAMWSNELLLMALLAIGFFTLFVSFKPIYRSWRLTSIRAELAQAGILWLTAVAATSLVANLKLFGDVDGLMPTWALITFLGIILTKGTIRVGLRAVRIRGGNFRTTAIVGANETATNLAEYVLTISWMGLRFVGYYDDRSGDANRRLTSVDVSGNIDDLISRARTGEIDIIYISLPLSAEQRIKEITSALSDTTASVYFVPNFAVLGFLSPRWDAIGGIPIISLVDTPHQGIDSGLKRTVDIIGAFILLVIMAIPMLTIAFLIKMKSSGSVIFKQKRYGLGGKRIEIWKFRTMNVSEDGENSFEQAKINDNRVTPLGLILRRTSADELPQLIQVLKGDLSLVGPRPHPVALNETHRKFIGGYMLRHKVKPGITGWAQVNGYRGETDTDDKMRKRIDYDLDYINNWSIGLDLKILFMTISRIFDDPNAY